jgi:predicted DNA-binding antitoxin AbrB/MazE fold protein
MNIIVNNLNTIRITDLSSNNIFEDIKFFIAKSLNPDILLKCQVDEELFDLIRTSEEKQNYYCYKVLKLKSVYLKQGEKQLIIKINGKDTEIVQTSLDTIDWNVTFLNNGRKG